MSEDLAGNPPVDGGSVEATQPTQPVQQAPDPSAAAPLLGGGGSEKEVAAPATWPEDWRNKFAGSDDKRLNRLGRFGSPEDLAKSYFELEKKLSSRPTAPTLPENATPEQVSEYRKAIGVPDEGKYDTDLGGGFIWADADKEVLEDFQKHAFEANMPGGEFKKALAWYAQWQERQQSKSAEMDAEFRSKAEDELREEWGADYRRNVNAINSLFSTLNDETKSALFTARMPDGRLIGDHPEMVRFFANMARELNPAATLVPSSGGDPAKGVADRIAEIEKRMAEDRVGYFKDTAMQAEYDRLLQARQKMASR